MGDCRRPESTEGKTISDVAKEKVPFIGHRPPGRLVVYYRHKGDIVCVSPSGRDRDWERALQGSPDPGERVYLTFTDEPVEPMHLATAYRAVHWRGDIPITPSAREVRGRLRAAARARRASFYHRDRHPRSALREARRVYAAALVTSCEDLSPEEKKTRGWFLSCFLRRAAPSVGMWCQLRESGTPPVETLFTALDYLPEVPWTKRRKRSAYAVGFAGELARYVNTPEGEANRERVLTAQAHGEPMPLLDIPLENRVGGAREDPRWLRRHDESCLLRKARMRLCRCDLCNRWLFAAPGGHPRCPMHGDVWKEIRRARKRALRLP